MIFDTFLEIISEIDFSLFDNSLDIILRIIKNALINYSNKSLLLLSSIHRFKCNFTLKNKFQ